jgi:hypothetical protein
VSASTTNEQPANDVATTIANKGNSLAEPNGPWRCLSPARIRKLLSLFRAAAATI